jgi:hypothetical protein
MNDIASRRSRYYKHIVPRPHQLMDLGDHESLIRPMRELGCDVNDLHVFTVICEFVGIADG